MREHALAIFNAAVSVVQPSSLLPPNIYVESNTIWLYGKPFVLKQSGEVYVIGAGKASAAMAYEAEKILRKYIKKGVVVTKYHHSLPLEKIKCIEAGHPVSDENSICAAKEILEIVQHAGENDIVIFLISGGASALLADCPPGILLNQLQHLSGLLLRCGATINEINTVRKHLSLIKGGQLANAAYPATLVSLILSDVIADPLDVIASGLTVPDTTGFKEAHDVLMKYELAEKIHPAINSWIQKGLNGEVPDTPKPGDKIFERTSNHIIGNNRMALEAAAKKAKNLGFAPFIFTDKLQGEARDQAKLFTEHIFQHGYKKQRPACILMGGETTVTIKGKGKGGRNQEFALAALAELMKTNQAGIDSMPLILAAGTDGTDGPTDAAGAVVDITTIQKAKSLQLDAATYLNNNDSYNFFKQAGGHIITGPTQTNVMDIVVALF